MPMCCRSIARTGPPGAWPMDKAIESRRAASQSAVSLSLWRQTRQAARSGHLRRYIFFVISLPQAGGLLDDKAEHNSGARPVAQSFAA